MARRFALPARAVDVHEQNVGEDIVLISAATGQATALSGLVADVWRATGTGGWVGPVDDQLHAAIDQLIDAGLLVQPAGLSRRRVLQGIGAATVVGGLASVALPAVDAAASTHIIDFGTGASVPANQPAGSHTLTVAASVTPTVINFTLVGAGGGGAGSSGGNAGVVSGTFTVPASGTPTTFTVITASGGLGGNAGGTGGSGWVSGTGFAKDAGDGGQGHGSTPATGGGGGGSTAFYATGGSTDPLAVAGGGGGAGGNAGGGGGAGNAGTATGAGADSGGSGTATGGTAATGGTTTVSPATPRGIGGANVVESGGARGTGLGGSLGTNRVGGVGGTGGDGDAQGSSAGGGGGGGGAAGGGGGMGGQKNSTESQGGGGGSGYDNGTVLYAVTGQVVTQAGASPAGIGGTTANQNGTGGYASFTTTGNISGSTP